MKTRTFSWLAALTLLSGATLSAQVAGESQTPTEQPPMYQEAEVPAPAEVDATVATDTAVPTPEAGAVQTPEETAAIEEPKLDSDADAIDKGEVAAAETDVAIETAEPAADLPRTASPLALLALLGLGSSGTALGVRFARRRR